MTTRRAGLLLRGKAYGKRAVCLIALAFLAGCVHTPEARIREHQELFSSYPEEIQEAIRSGQVQLGFTKEMTYLALGEPDRKVVRRTAGEAEREIWYYQGRFVTTDTIRVYDQFGRFRPVRPPVYLDRTTEHVYTRARLDFENGEIVAIEQTER